VKEGRRIHGCFPALVHLVFDVLADRYFRAGRVSIRLADFAAIPDCGNRRWRRAELAERPVLLARALASRTPTDLNPKIDPEP
jgi:hypothetical protein